MDRIVQGMSITEVLKKMRAADGYYVTNTARDLSQSDFKNRILLHTDLLAAKAREKANYFSLEITGGASVHVDILRKRAEWFVPLDRPVMALWWQPVGTIPTVTEARHRLDRLAQVGPTEDAFTFRHFFAAPADEETTDDR